MLKTNILPQYYIEIINKNSPNARIVGGEYFASGVDADVFKLTDEFGVNFALKKSKDNFFDNANDINQDDVALFKQEAEYSNIINQANIELVAPKSIYVNDNADTSFHLMAFVADDATLLNKNGFVALLSQLHSLEIDKHMELLPISHEGYDDVNVTIAKRTLRRIENLKKFIDVDLDWLTFGKIFEFTSQDTNEKCLLHMDFRRSNLLCYQNQVFVIDWANALIGSPLIEIARLGVFGEIDTSFKRCYLDLNPHVVYFNSAYLMYMLDTAVMMNLVFLSSAPDVVMANKFAKKLHDIIARLKRGGIVE